MNNPGATAKVTAERRGIKGILEHPELKPFFLAVAIFLGAYFLPFNNPRVGGAILEGFYMLQEYAREHVLFCLIPAFFIAGAIANFISQGTVLRYLGAEAPRWLAVLMATFTGMVYGSLVV